MPPRRRSLDTRGRFGRYPPLTKIPRANKSDVAETRAREPRGPVERICRSGNIRPGGYIGAVCGNFAAPFRPPLPWASEPALAKLQGIRIRYRARRHTIHSCGCHFNLSPPPRGRQRPCQRRRSSAITSRRSVDGQKGPPRRARRKKRLLPIRAHAPGAFKKVQHVAPSGLTIKDIRAVLLVYYHQTTPTNIKKTTAVATLEQAVKQNPSGIYAAPDPSAVATSGSGDSSEEEEASDDEE